MTDRYHETSIAADTLGSEVFRALVHPFAGGLATANFKYQALPIPPIAEIPAGFDTILQFRSDHLDERLALHIRSERLSLMSFFSVEASALPDEIRTEISNRVLQASGTSTTIDPETGATVSIHGTTSVDHTAPDISQFDFRVTLNNPRIRFPPALIPFAAGDIKATVRWSVSVAIGLPRPTAATPATPFEATTGVIETNLEETTIGLQFPGVTSGEQPTADLDYVPVSGGVAFASCEVDLTKRPHKYQAWAWLEFLPNAPAIGSTDRVFNELMKHGLPNAVNTALAPITSQAEIRITPVTSIGGLMLVNETLADIGSFRPKLVVSPGNTPDHQVLSICLNVGPPVEEGDPELVRPFVGERNYGYYVSQRIVQAVMRARWERSGIPRRHQFASPMVLEKEDGERFVASATLRFTFTNFSSVTFAPGVRPNPDAIRVEASYEMELRQIVHENEVIPRDDLPDEWKARETFTFVMRIHPFGSKAETATFEEAEFLYGVLAHLMAPVYAPVASRLGFHDIEGQLSASADALVFTARLNPTPRVPQ